jgi:hypothetical protein
MHVLGEYRLAGQELEVGDGIDSVEGDSTRCAGASVRAATPAIHLQCHVRYASVGAVATVGSGTFYSDTLSGLNDRWYFRPDFALVTGYKFGGITTWNTACGPRSEWVVRSVGAEPLPEGEA